MLSENSISNGERYETKKLITDEGIKLFSNLSGDFNPIHIDESYASKSFFKKRIAHGMYYASFFSAIIANHLPGSGSIYLAQNLKFLNPVYIGDIVTSIVSVEEINKEKKYIFLKTLAFNQHGEKLIEGDAKIKYYGDKELL